MNKENKSEAKKLVMADARNLAKYFRREFEGVKVVNPDDIDDWPSGSGDGLLVNITVGQRDDLTKRSARAMGAMWREAWRRYPKGVFYPHLLGFDQDSREIWEIPEAARYIRWWARFAGLDKPEIFAKQLGADNAVHGETVTGALSLVLLACCGVFGDELKQEALRNQKPPTTSH